MFGIEFMTDKERQGTLTQINYLENACKVDQDAVYEAFTELGANINICIHINMLKCEVLQSMKKPIYPLSAEDYVEICKEPNEEARRYKLSAILANKDREAEDMTNKNLGKVLSRKDDPAEPVLSPVAEKDKEVGGIAVERLRSLIERIERLQEEAKGIASDIRDIFAEAKAAGFDTKAMRAIIKLRKMNAADRDKQEALLDTYKKALDI